MNMTRFVWQILKNWVISRRMLSIVRWFFIIFLLLFACSIHIWNLSNNHFFFSIAYKCESIFFLLLCQCLNAAVYLSIWIVSLHFDMKYLSCGADISEENIVHIYTKFNHVECETKSIKRRYQRSIVMAQVNFVLKWEWKLEKEIRQKNTFVIRNSFRSFCDWQYNVWSIWSRPLPQ